MSLKEIVLDGIKYLRADTTNIEAEKLNGLEYRLIRCDRSGVFAGYIKKLDGKTVIILQARRIFYWSGAASLSQLAIDGTSKPSECKFPEAVSEIMVTDCIEILNVTDKAKKSIDGVKVWKV
jgi:hypothetical protein